MATDQKVGSSNLLTHGKTARVVDFGGFFFVKILQTRICGGFLAHVQKGNHRLFFIVCCLRKARTRDLLRFLLNPCIHYLPFADNSLLRSSDSRSVAEISTDLATEASQWSRCFCFSLSSIEKHSPAFPFLYTTLRKETASHPASVRKKFCKSTLSASR